MKTIQLKRDLSHCFYISKLVYKAKGFLLAFPFIFHVGFPVVALTLAFPPPVLTAFHHQTSSFCFSMACSVTLHAFLKNLLSFSGRTILIVLGATCRQGSIQLCSLTQPGVDGMWTWEGSRTWWKNSFIMTICHFLELHSCEYEAVWRLWNVLAVPR